VASGAQRKKKSGETYKNRSGLFRVWNELFCADLNRKYKGKYKIKCEDIADPHRKRPKKSIEKIRSEIVKISVEGRKNITDSKSL